MQPLSEVPPDRLAAASDADLGDSLRYALTFSSTGRAHRVDLKRASELEVAMLADRLIMHLRLSGFVVMRKLPAKAHSTG